MSAKEYDKDLLQAFGKDVFISSNVDIRRPHLVSMGSHIAIDSGFYITTSANFGDYIHIGPHVLIIGGAHSSLKLGNFTNLTLGSKIICGSDSFSGHGLVSAPGIPKEFLNEVTLSSVVIEDFAAVCASAIVFPGVTISEGSVVGANSVLTKDTLPWTIYTGTPARPIKKRPREKMLEYARRLGY